MECEFCGEKAVLWVSERYESPDGIGVVERDDPACVECAGKVSPDGLDGVYANYEYRIEPIPEEFGMVQVGQEDVDRRAQ